jgi:hypothetical protein
MGYRVVASDARGDGHAPVGHPLRRRARLIRVGMTEARSQPNHREGFRSDGYRDESCAEKHAPNLLVG